MIKSCVLAFLLLGCAPHSEYDRTYSIDESNKARTKMAACALAVKKLPYDLDGKAQDRLYSQCLTHLGAAI
ncbi:MAG: hypothetical protein CMK71_02600 [Pseudomonadaceae bacterium]|mgnify:CR=1 FL=1|nr:hypothetical protein [Pseudomonadaceae bacterium]